MCISTMDFSSESTLAILTVGPLFQVSTVQALPDIGFDLLGFDSRDHSSPRKFL